MRLVMIGAGGHGRAVLEVLRDAGWPDPVGVLDDDPACRGLPGVPHLGLDTLLATRAEGLDLMLDHRASGLSGGELRRLALARAILSDRPLILCDEPTADLDADSAAAVTTLLRHLAARYAVIVATHDAALAAVADQQVMV